MNHADQLSDQHSGYSDSKTRLSSTFRDITLEDPFTDSSICYSKSQPSLGFDHFGR